MKNRKLLIKKDQKIIEAIKKINSSRIKILFVVDNKNRLIGSVSSGDIRRSIRRKINPYNYVSRIMNKKPKYLLNTSEINKNLDSLICLPIVDKNRKIINYKFSKNIKKDKKNTIFLMAGGKGKRLMPLTKNTPKPLLKIKGRPIIERVIINFKKQGFKNFVISLNYLGNKIKKYLGNGKKYNVNIMYLNEKKYLGTAGSLALLNIKKTIFPIIVSNSDLISEVDYNNLIDYHLTKKSDFTICAKTKLFEMPYGEILLKGSKIKKIIEKPILNHLVNAGIYVLDKKVIKDLLINKRLMMNDLISNQLKKNKKIMSYPIYEKWIDIGTKFDFYKVR